MIKLEQKFLTAFRREYRANHPGVLYFKIPDAPTKFQSAKPFDSFSLWKGEFTCYEAKSIKDKAPLKFSDLRPSQVEGLQLAYDNGGKAYVLGYYHSEKKYICVPYIFLKEQGSIPYGTVPFFPITI